MRVGILGANGQVGAELMLYLADEPGVEVVGFMRDSYSAKLLRMNDLPFCLYSDSQYPDLIRSCHVVVDCTYPGGQTVNIPEMIRQSFIQTLALMKRDAHYISLSSVMAYGVPEGDAEMKLHRVSQTVYGAIKRQSELDLFRIGKDASVNLYAFRLGQTHGVLQAATQSYRHALTYGDGVIHGGPEDALNTIFVHSLARALLKCGRESLYPLCTR